MQKFRNKKPTKRAHANPLRSFPSVARNALIIATCGGLGYWSLMNAGATTFFDSSEAEQGALAGNSTLNSDTTASNRAAVGFGTYITAPTHVKAYTGGDSIAVVWEMPKTGKVQSIQIFRNGGQIATVTPGTGTLKVERQGTRFIDKAVTNGAQYSYQVRAVAPNGTTSVLSPAVSVKQQLKTPVPNVVIDTSKDNTYTSYLTNYMIPEIKTWYPKLADAIAVDGYTPYPGTITIFPDPDCNCVVNTNWANGRITVHPRMLEIPENGEEGMFLHEATHALQAYSNDVYAANVGLTEGIADWTREWFMFERYKVYIPSTRATLANGYSEGSYMLHWATFKYNKPNLVRDLNIALHNNTYTSNFFTDLTGKTAEQLYAEMNDNYFSGPGAIKTNDKCLKADASTIQLAGCDSSGSQTYKLRYTHIDIEASVQDKTRFSLLAPAVASTATDDYCLDIPQSSTTSGTIVQSWSCNNSNAQEWVVGNNGSLINPNSGKCLATQGGSFSDNTKLIITDCNGSASQKWTIPQ